MQFWFGLNIVLTAVTAFLLLLFWRTSKGTHQYECFLWLGLASFTGVPAVLSWILYGLVTFF